MATKESSETTNPKSIFQTRYTFVLLGFFGFINVYAMRVNLNVAIIAMVKQSNISNTTTVKGVPCKELRDQMKNKTSSTIKPITGEFEWDSYVQGAVLGSYFYGYIIPQIPGGYFADKYGAKWLFGGGMLLTSFFTLLTPIAARWNVWALVVARVIEGIGQGVAFPTMNALIGHWAPKLERSRISTIIYNGGNMGTVVTLAASGVLSQKVGWSSVFYVSGALGCVWFILWAVLVFEKPVDHPRISKEELILIRKGNEIKSRPPIPWKSILTSIPVCALVTTHIGYTWGLYTLINFLPMYFSNILLFDLKNNGLLSALPHLVLTLSSIIASILADKLRKSGKLRISVIRKIFNTIGYVGPALCFIAVSFSGCRPILIMALICLSMSLLGCTYSGFFCTHVDMSPDFAGILAGISFFVGNFAGFLVPAYIGWILQDGQTMENSGTIFITSSAVMTFTALIYDVFSSAELQPWGVGEQNEARS